MTLVKEKTKEERIKTEYRRLAKNFKELPEGKKKIAEKLIKNAAFMIVTLSDLEEIVNEEGPIVTLVNGNGKETTTENPAQKSYIAMMNRFNSTMKILVEMLPEQAATNSKLLELMKQ